MYAPIPRCVNSCVWVGGKNETLVYSSYIQKRDVVNDFETEPYECGWAGESRWFIRVIEADDKGSELYSTGIQNFGNWLRLRGTLKGSDASFKLIIYLVLKE